MPTANSMQIGGNHYKTAREHWDLCIAIGMGPPYLACTATKYIARWRKKNGLQDLQKALHYVNKLLENQDKIKFTGKRNHDIQVEVERFVEANKLTEIEELAVDCLAQLVDERDLYCAQSYILLLMDEAEPQPVPLEDSNKHALQDSVDG